MKLTVFGTFLLFAYACGEISNIPEDDSGKHEKKLYDVHQLVQEAAKSIESVKTIDENKQYLMTNNIYNNVKLLNVLNLLPVLINSVSIDSNSTCSQDLSYIKENIDLKNIQDSWALKMLDSFGKPESAFLEGNTKWLGDFDECRSVYAPKKQNSEVGGFHGQYCTLGVTVAKLLPISIGVCLPDTCDPLDLKELVNISNIMPLINKTGIDFNVTSITCNANSLELSAGGIVTLCLMSVFSFLVLLGSSATAFKYFTDSNTLKDSGNENEGSAYLVKDNLSEPLVVNEGSSTKIRDLIDKCDPFLNCFCIFTNGSKLLNTDSTEGQLLCLHGIRFLSMTWVILCHVYMSPVAAIRSMANLVPLIDNLPFQVILNGWYSVDSFFVLSGFLLSYLYFQECEKKQGKTPWLYFYVHRYLRLTPVYMLVLAFYTTVMPVMGSGPFWPNTNIDPNCQKRWWWNLIYINNFQEQGEQCFGWSWYLANDMQFFVISPLFLITLWRWPRVGFTTLALFLGGSCLAGFLITYHYNLLAGTLSYAADISYAETFIERWTEYMNKIYVKPYTRIAPYLLGIGLGYILFQRKTTNFKIYRITLWIGWLLATSVGLYGIYGIYHQHWSLVGASFFNALHRTGFGLSLSWLIFVCLSGQAGAVDKILSYKLFIPLSRLTYCAYLIHPILIAIYISSLKTTLEFTHQTIVVLFLGLLIVSYAFAMLVSLIFESPIIRLEKLIRNKFQNK